MTVKEQIQKIIIEFGQKDLFNAGISLFKTLGYNTERRNRLDNPTFEGFCAAYIENSDKISDIEKFKEKAHVHEWKKIEILFQLTESEMSYDGRLFGTKKVDDTLIEAYLFFAIELTGDNYTRTVLSNITRQINKVFLMPVMILFKYNGLITLSVIGRRINKKDENKDILKKVTLIKDISIQNPHRAHIEILFDLSFDELKRNYKCTNFVELHNAWQKTLDTKELNKKFYQKIFNWYLWAHKYVKFPQIRPKKDVIEDDQYQSESLIRLITRLLFVWFMKEKRLVNSELFDCEKLKSILKDFKGVNGETTIYYKAILQNLFFATINKPIEQRKIIDKGFNPKEYGDPLVYRYDELFQKPNNLLKYFENIPFLNGGLFECLDQKKDNENPVEVRLDGFSTKIFKQAIFPDKLFFGKYANIDLSDVYNDKRKKNMTVFGIIDILNQHKFTIEENTPIEEEIALDPELLGKVFENLLASYNPETKTTARKQTGSFYTPREIVNYMVDESLKTYLKQKLETEAKMKPEDAECGLKVLLGYNEKDNLFNEEETLILIKAIDGCKIIDPACGSGAFPMGIFHKLIFILQKLDPKNEIWLDMVVNNVPEYMQLQFRSRLKKENWNYVRKLGIIQQCIYGVDIQPIATQIAKLRFFISLLVDQSEKPGETNRGFEPLPNLDFKIVTANTLIPVPQSDEITTGLFENQTDSFFEQFNELTYNYFNKSKPEDKKELRKKINSLVKRKIEEKIIQTESNFKTALDSRFNKVIEKKNKKIIEKKEREISLWQSYTNIFKHESVGFFDPRYFFPMAADGFDIVIANPPYIKVQNLDHKAIDMYKSIYTFAYKRLDISLLFFEKGLSLLRKSGTLTFISSNQFLVTEYGQKAREGLLKYNLKQLIDFQDLPIFENALTYVSIFVLVKEKGESVDFARINDIDILERERGEIIFQKIEYSHLGDKYWVLDNLANLDLIKKLKTLPRLKNYAESHYGIISGKDDLLLLNEDTIKKENIEDIYVRKIIFPQDISKWNIKVPKNYIVYPYELKNKTTLVEEKKIKKNSPNLYDYLLRNKKELECRKDSRKTLEGRKDWYGLIRFSSINIFKKEKIISPTIVNNNKFALDKSYFSFSGGKTVVITSEKISLKYLLAILNSKFANYFYNKNTPVKAGGYHNYSATFILELPIKNISFDQQKPFINLIDKILLLSQLDDYLQNPVKQTNVKEYEKQINQMVYQLYCLTDDEIEIVENFNKKA